MRGPEFGGGPSPSIPRNLPEVAARPTSHETTFTSNCGHCASSSTFLSPRFPVQTPPTPVRFAVKCAGQQPSGEACKRVRVYAVLEVPPQPPAVSEIPPVLPLYPFIRRLERARGRRATVARFLISACDLHMLGLLESDPGSRDAAFDGSAIHLRKAAELFLCRCVLNLRVDAKGRLPKASEMITRLKKSGSASLRPGMSPWKVARLLQYIFDVGDVAAHPEITNKRLRRVRLKRPATDGSIRRCLANFDLIVGMVR